MAMSRVERATAVGGTAGAMLLAASFVLVSVDAPAGDATRAQVVAAYTDGGTHARQGIGLLLMALAAFCLLPFLGSLRSVLAKAAGRDSALPGVALASGAVLVGVLAVSTVLAATVSLSADFFDAYRVDADLALTAAAASFFLDGFAAVAGGVMIGSVSLAAVREHLLPRWLTTAGLAVAVGSLPTLLLGFWLIVEGAWIAVAAGLLGARASALSVPSAPEVPAGAVSR